MILDKQADFNLSVLGGGRVRFHVGYATAALQCDAALYTTGTWDHIALSWDGNSAVEMYSNGAAVAATVSTPLGTRNSDAGIPLVIGNVAKAPINGALLADLDEIRISNVVRSPDWIRAQHLSQLGTNLVFGSMETITP
jgi:hypothetical protein